MTPIPAPRRALLRLAAWALCSALPAGHALAQGGPTDGVLNQRLWVQFSAYHPDVDTRLRVDDPAIGLQGSDLALESELGLARRKTLGALLVGARLGERWRGELEHFALKRSANQFPINRSVTIDDTTYAASALIDSEFESRVTRLSVGYSLLRTPAAEAGAVVGLHVTRFAFAIEGQGNVGGQPATLRREARDGTVPLPTIGLYSSWAFAPRWIGNGRVDLFSFKHGGYDGRLVNVQANLVYRFSPNLGIGLGYRHDDYTFDARRGDFTGSIDYRFRGPQIFVDAGF